MENVLFCNPPWWVDIPFSDGGDGPYEPVVRAGIRAGSRWPYTTETQSRPDNFVSREYLPYPFFLGSAATYVAAHAGAQVDFRDSIALRESYESFLRFLAAKRYDYIFLESATSSWDHDRKLIRKINALCPWTRIVLCGPITVKAAELLAHYPLHACIHGEYEKGAVRVVKDGESGEISHDLLTVEEMNRAPFPYMDSVHVGHYWDHAQPFPDRPQTNPEHPQAIVWGSRGCPYKCIFCVWPAVMTGNDPDGTGKRTVRFYSADYIGAWVRWLIDAFQVSCIYFDDDTFNLGDRHVQAVCAVMKDMDIPWSAMCRADTISRDTWVLMKEAGCYNVKIGFESGSQWVVDNIVNKRLDLEKAREVVHFLHQLGVTVHGTFTYGLPGETAEQMMETKRFIASMPLNTYQESGTAEIEGTPLSTLRQSKSLRAYAGATLAAGYEINADGNLKMASIRNLLNSFSAAR